MKIDALLEFKNYSRKFMLITAALMLGPTTAYAANVDCNGTLAAGVYDNVSVSNGASCTLNSSVTINNNLSANNAADIIVDGVLIKGNLIIDSSNGSSLYITNAIINKNISISNSQYKTNLNIGNCTINGNVNIINNKVNVENNPPYPGTFDNSLILYGGSIGGNLNLSENQAYHWILGGESTKINGNVTINDNYSIANLVGIVASINGSLNFLSNRGGGSTDLGSTPLGIIVLSTDVGGNINISENKGLNGSVIDIETVTGSKNIMCSNNTPLPITGYYAGGPAPVVSGKNNCDMAP